MVWWRWRCSVRSPIRRSPRLRPRTRGPARSSAAFAPCRRRHSPMPSVCSVRRSPRFWARSSTSTSASSCGRRGAGRPLAGPRVLRSQGAVLSAIGAALLPAYWLCWRRPQQQEPIRARATLTSIIAFIVWWGFLAGHVPTTSSDSAHDPTPTPSADSPLRSEQRSRCSTLSRSSWISRCSRSIRRSVSLFSARSIHEMPSIPHSGSSLRRCTGTAGPQRPVRSALGRRHCSAVARAWTQRLWLGWICVISAFAMLACVYLTLPWFRL